MRAMSSWGPAGDWSTRPVHSVRDRTSIAATSAAMRLHGRSSLAVVDDHGQAVGVVTRTDLLRVARADGALVAPSDRTVREAMSSPVITVQPDEDLAAAARRMVERRVHRLFSLNEGAPDGVIGTLELMRAVAGARVGGAIATLMRAPVITVSVDEPIARAVEHLAEAAVSGLVVVDDDWPVGLFTQREALEAADLSPAAPVEEAMSPALLCLDVGTPVHRAAAQASATRGRRILAVEGRRVRGILTGLDFARLVAGEIP